MSDDLEVSRGDMISLARKWSYDIWGEADAPAWEPPPGGYLGPSEVDGLETTAKVVRLDVAIMALHLAAANALTKSIPGVIAVALNGFLQTVVTQATLWIVGKAAGQVFTEVSKALTIMARTFQESAMQIPAERAVRKQCLDVMKDVQRDNLSKAKNAHRVTKEVVTRHWSGKQRRRNGHAAKHYPKGVRRH